MKMFEKIIRNHLQGRKVLLLFIITNIVYVLMLTVTIPNVMEHTEGMKLLDMMPLGYDAEYVNTLFRTLGQTGRNTYLYRQIPMDMIYPLLFGISFSLLLAYFLNKLNKLKTPFLYLCLLPMLAAMADYAENIGIITLLNDYPEISKNTVTMTNSFSLLKSSCTTLSFVVFIFVLLTLGIKSFRKTVKRTEREKGCESY
ncbi:hypothetical protein LCGC14_1836730 [marine sediment metagenome]|uniref:Uncharacterized protein n=2 Tax=root TaxID=1 RepID=A0A831QN55_9FLAO|nr:hypothetical protein [Pricia antarctica]